MVRTLWVAPPRFWLVLLSGQRWLLTHAIATMPLNWRQSSMASKRLSNLGDVSTNWRVTLMTFAQSVGRLRKTGADELQQDIANTGDGIRPSSQPVSVDTHDGS